MLPATVLTDEITAFGIVAAPMSAAILGIFYLMLDRNNAKLMDRINGKYMSTPLAIEKFKAVDDKFAVVHHRIDDMTPAKAHK